MALHMSPPPPQQTHSSDTEFRQQPDVDLPGCSAEL
jgi:hypothetical protein